MAEKNRYYPNPRKPHPWRGLGPDGYDETKADPTINHFVEDEEDLEHPEDQSETEKEQIIDILLERLLKPFTRGNYCFELDIVTQSQDIVRNGQTEVEERSKFCIKAITPEGEKVLLGADFDYLQSDLFAVTVLYNEIPKIALLELRAPFRFGQKAALRTAEQLNMQLFSNVEDLTSYQFAEYWANAVNTYLEAHLPGFTSEYRLASAGKLLMWETVSES